MSDALLPADEPNAVAEGLRAFLNAPDLRHARIVFPRLAELAEARWAATALSAALLHPDAQVRRRAAFGFGLLGDAVTGVGDVLRAALADPAWIVREAVLQTLAELPGPADQLLRFCCRLALHDPQPLVRARAAQVAARHGDVATEEFRAALRHPHSSIRRRALEALAKFPEERQATVPLLRAALEDSHAEVRLAAVRGLGSLGSSGGSALGALPRLLRCAFAGEPRVSAAAREAMQQLLAGDTTGRFDWLIGPAAAEFAPGTLLRRSLSQPNLSAGLQQEFIAACSRRTRWHHCRRRPAVAAAGCAASFESAWEAAQATGAAARGTAGELPDRAEERELAWLLSWWCELILRCSPVDAPDGAAAAPREGFAPPSSA